MKLYADSPGRLIRQGIADVVALVVVAGFLAAGGFIYQQIHGLSERTRAVADAAGSSSRAITDGAATLKGVPLIGDSLGGQLGRLSTLTGQTADTLRRQADQFALQAPLVALVIGIGGSALVVTGWWAGRGRWIRTASAVNGPLDPAELAVLAMSARGPRRADAAAPPRTGRRRPVAGRGSGRRFDGWPMPSWRDSGSGLGTARVRWATRAPRSRPTGGNPARCRGGEPRFSPGPPRRRAVVSVPATASARVGQSPATGHTGQGASTSRSACQPPRARATQAARTPVTSDGLCIRPASTASTSSPSGTRITGISASSSCPAYRGPGGWDRVAGQVDAAAPRWSSPVS